MDQCGDRCRAFHRIGQPDVQRELRRLPASSHEQQQARSRNPWIADGKMSAARHLVHVGVLQRAEIPGNSEHAQQEAGITNAIGNECFVRGGRGRMAQEVEADEQVRAKADALPADEHEGIVVPQDERQHGEHEQVQVAEKPVVAAFVAHVADRVNVDQHPHAGNKQQPDGRQRIEQEAGISAERSGLDGVGDVGQAVVGGTKPGVDDLLEWRAVMRGRIPRVLPDRETRPREGQHHHADTNSADRRLLQSAPEEEHARCTDGGKQRDQPDVV